MLLDNEAQAPGTAIELVEILEISSPSGFSVQFVESVAEYCRLENLKISVVYNKENRVTKLKIRENE